MQKMLAKKGKYKRATSAKLMIERVSGGGNPKSLFLYGFWKPNIDC